MGRKRKDVMAMIKHPTIYVFSGSTESEGILREAEQTHPAGGLFCAHGIESIREVKTRIQSGESGLNIKRVHVYAVANANETTAEAILSLHDMFREDFTSVVITPVVLLDESAPGKASREFLSALSENQAAFDKIFLLSSRNEHDITTPEYKQNLHAIIANLPLLHTVQSHFDEIMTAKAREQGQTLFASAGLWQREKPKPTQSNQDHAAVLTLHAFANELDKTMAAGARETLNTEPSESLIPREEIISNIVSVAANPLRFWQLWGRTIKEAETMLYGEEANRFFEEQYMEPQAPEITFEPQTLPLKTAVAQEKHLRQAVTDINAKIAQLSHKIQEAEVQKTPLSMGSVKDIIGECYAMRYELNQLRAARTGLTAQQLCFETYLEHVRHVVQQLRAMPIPEAPESTPQAPPETREYLLSNAERLAPFAVSLLRDDNLLREQHVLYDERNQPRLLRLIGGFIPEDLMFWQRLG